VQSWISEEALHAIRFMLDNEIYVLAAPAATWKTPSFLIPVEEIDEVDEVDEVEESPRAA
jgi:hypothetical protein